MIQRVGAKDIHVVVMDIDFPKNDGIERLKAIRNADRMPIIVLSENDREQMKIAALNAGADDYVMNPFHPLEFMARVNCQFRRYTQLARMKENIDRIYRVDDLVLDDIIRKVTVAGKEVNLTPIEYKILRLLVQEKGRVFSINQIYESIWNMQAIGYCASAKRRCRTDLLTPEAYRVKGGSPSTHPDARMPPGLFLQPFFTDLLTPEFL